MVNDVLFTTPAEQFLIGISYEIALLHRGHMTKMLKEWDVCLKVLRLIDIHSVYVTLFKAYRQNGELLQDVRKSSGLVLEQLPKRPDYEVKVMTL